jgi:hypothetical protein
VAEPLENNSQTGQGYNMPFTRDYSVTDVSVRVSVNGRMWSSPWTPLSQA